MKPRKLRIKGLNSFIEEQEIDFERLTNKGLFGIFGPTGSGKSTILDAMTMSLYGAISRDTREFMNSLCSSLSVSFEFEIGVGSERKVYIADRVINKDKTGAYKLKISRLREISEGIDNPIAEGANEVKSAVERIVGLTADDFTRSVVLPQGKFNEFLKLTGKDRRNMLERIFRLEKFGKNLGDRIRNAKKEKNDSLNVLSGRLRTYEERGVSEDRYKELEMELKMLLGEEEVLKKEKQKLDEEYEKSKALWELQEELEYYHRKLGELELQTSEILAMKEKLLKAQNALMVKPLIDELRELDNKIVSNNLEIQNCRVMLDELKLKIAVTEKEYKEWQGKKDNELPLLIQKEGNLNRAIELEAAVREIEKDRDALLQQYNVHKTKKQQVEKELEELSNNRQKLLEEEAALEKRLEEIKIEPEYREMVQKAAMVEEEYQKALKEKEELVKKEKDKLVSIDNLDKHLSEVLKQRDQCFRELALTESSVEKLAKEVPGDNRSLLEKKDRINSLEGTIKEAEANQKRLDELSESISKLVRERLEFENSLKEINAVQQDKQKELAALEEEISHIEKSNLASMLSRDLHGGEPCPVCGSTEHPILAEPFDESILGGRKTQKAELDKMLTEGDKKIRSLEIRLATVTNNENYLNNEYAALSEKLKGIKLDGLKEEKLTCEAEFKDISRKIEEWNKDKEAAEKSLSKIKDEKSSIDREEVKLSENIRSEKKILKEIEVSLGDNETRCTYLNREYTELREELKLEDIKGKLKELRDFEKESLELRKRQKALVEKINEYDSKKDAFNKDINNSELEIAKILESGREKRAVIDRDRSEINRLSEGRPAEEYLGEVTKVKTEIIRKEESLRSVLEKEKEELQKLNDKLLNGEAGKFNLDNMKRDLETKLQKAMDAYNIASVQEVILQLLSKEEMDSIEKAVNTFEDSLKNVKANIERLGKRLNGRAIAREEWEELQKRRIYAGEALELKIRDIAMKTQSLRDMEKDIEEFTALNAKKKELEHVCSNLDDLAKLVEGNKFVEYVAMSQLKYISMEASKRLKDITRGRYALEIDSTGNFIMRDDFNGGARRATSTLSGGETFLTSLCLALSLSSQIQLKGSAPLEFFFLDEGFGTLDTDLLETVMSSLERLHSDKLCVGIISHVEELKNRVPIKLVVEPAEHGKNGSRVRIELS